MLLRGVIAVIEYFKSWVDLMKEMAVIDWKNPVESLKAISKITLPGMFVDMARAFERADAALNAIDEKRSEKWFERQREIRERDKREWPEKWKRMREPAGGLYTGGGWRETGAAGGVGGTERSDRVAVLQERIKRAQEQYEDRVKRAEELAEAFAEVEEKLREVDELLAKTIESTNRRLAAGIRGGIEAGFDEGWAGVGTWFLGRLKTGVLQAVEDALTQAFAARMVRESLSQIPIIGPFLGLLGFQSGGIIKGGRGGVPAIIGEGRSSEIVQPVTPQGITNLVRGISGAIKFPDMAPTFLFQGLDPRDVKVAQRVDRGWRTVLAETW